MSANWLNSLVDASPVRRHVAWAGELEFKSATESDRAGRTVQFLLRRPQAELASAHPFSAHTRRRRGHAGTMFLMSLEPLNGGPPLTGGAMLLNWASSPKGDTATFLINYEAERHPFLSCTRAGKDQEPTRWMSVFVEEDDQSQAVDQVQRTAVEYSYRDICIECNSRLRIETGGPHQGELRGHLASCSAVQPARKPKQQIKDSNLARLFTKNERFHRYMCDTFGYHVTDEYDADMALKAHLVIDSKADIDRDPRKAAEFNDLREDFVVWQEETFGPVEG